MIIETILKIRADAIDNSGVNPIDESLNILIAISPPGGAANA